MPGDLRRTTLVAVLAAAVGAGLVLTGVQVLDDRTTGPRAAGPTTTAPPDARTLDLAAGQEVACPEVYGAQPVLGRVFEAVDSVGERFLVNVTLTPYDGAGEYRLGERGNVLVLTAVDDVRPLGFAEGEVEVISDSRGEVTAEVELRSGGRVAVSGTWSCA